LAPAPAESKKKGIISASVPASDSSQAALEKVQAALLAAAAVGQHTLTGLPKKDAAFVARRKQVVGPTFHKLGLVVPFENDVGYRDLWYSDTQLGNLFKRMQREYDKGGAETVNWGIFDELKTFVTLANDECDPGMGLQLGLDLFSCGQHHLFQRETYSILSMAYELLSRPLFATIAKVHIRHRYRVATTNSAALPING
jgi:hypothetical protein